MNEYEKLKQKRQETVNSLPLYWAFGKKQFDELLEQLGIDRETGMSQLHRGPCGSIVLKSDEARILDTLKEIGREREAAIAADPTGDGFIYQMFLTELKNTEYGYTGEVDEALDYLGITWEQVKADARLLNGLKKAQHKIDESDTIW